MPGDDYGEYQNPVGEYGDQTSGTLVADNSKPPAKDDPASDTRSDTKPAPAAAAVIQVSVNPASGIKIADLIKIINTSPGIVPEFKGKIKLDKKTNTIEVPDFSAQKVLPGQEWRFDLGKAGNDWEISTAKLVAHLDGPTYWMFEENLQKSEERGYVTSKDPDEGLLRPSHDITDIRSGLFVGLTIPSEAIRAKNPPAPNTVPPQVCRLKSGKGLILLATDIAVQTKDKSGNDIISTDPFPVPKPIVGMSFFHELSAHASFFALGQDAEHSFPPDPAKNAVDRNAQQAEASYQKALAKEVAALQKKLEALIAAMRKN